MTQETKCNQCKLEGNNGTCDKKDCLNSSSQDWRIREREAWLKTDWCSAYIDWCKEKFPHIVPTDQEKVADYWLERISIILEEKAKQIEKEKIETEQTCNPYPSEAFDEGINAGLNIAIKIIRGTEKLV